MNQATIDLLTAQIALLIEERRLAGEYIDRVDFKSVEYKSRLAKLDDQIAQYQSDIDASSVKP